MLFPLPTRRRLFRWSEGSTSLIRSPRLSERAEAEVFIKYEALNPPVPSGSRNDGRDFKALRTREPPR
jgi:hypothetical protein